MQDFLAGIVVAVRIPVDESLFLKVLERAGLAQSTNLTGKIKSLLFRQLILRGTHCTLNLVFWLHLAQIAGRNCCLLLLLLLLSCECSPVVGRGVVRGRLVGVASSNNGSLLLLLLLAHQSAHEPAQKRRLLLLLLLSGKSIRGHGRGIVHRGWRASHEGCLLLLLLLFSGCVLLGAECVGSDEQGHEGFH